NNAYARTVGKGADKVPVSSFELEEQILEETLSTGLFNEPLYQPLTAPVLASFPHLRTMTPLQAQQWLWEHYCALSCAGRADFVRRIFGVDNVTSVEVESLSAIFGYQISHDRHTLPHPRPAELAQSFKAAVLLRTGWYDWGLNDALATWQLLMSSM